MAYKVYRYDVSEEPAGEAPKLFAEFETAGEALSLARRIVDDSLLEQLPSAASAEDLYDRFGCFGEGVLIHGDPPVGWHVYGYAKQRAVEIFRMK